MQGPSSIDPDNVPLTFVLQYSRDNGPSWRVLGQDLTGDSFQSGPLDALPGGTQGKMRVIASDGFHTAQVESAGTFTVPAKPLRATIVSPPAGVSVRPGESVTLRAMATDPQNVPLRGASRRWASDRPGNVGSGEVLTLRDLPLGAHVITLTATTSAGRPARRRTSFYVGYRVAVPVARNAAPDPHAGGT